MTNVFNPKKEVVLVFDVSYDTELIGYIDSVDVLKAFMTYRDTSTLEFVKRKNTIFSDDAMQQYAYDKAMPIATYVEMHIIEHVLTPEVRRKMNNYVIFPKEMNELIYNHSVDAGVVGYELMNFQEMLPMLKFTKQDKKIVHGYIEFLDSEFEKVYLEDIGAPITMIKSVYNEAIVALMGFEETYRR